ncbi:MAG TPA: response regulator, partial [Pseudomonadaceae bacterium]|nr:response regulator [Pseudomonadaceae bacterium]
MEKAARDLINLLIVEDDEDDYVLTITLLQQAEFYDFQVDWVLDAREARKIFQENRHDICLMDYRLGADMSINLVREATDLGFDAPIIMLTGQDDAGVEMEAAAAGAVDYLIKDNLVQEQLLRSIRYALARSEMEAERYERVQAESANRSKTEFLAMLSHEIRTPLTAILGYTELLTQQYQQQDAALAHKLQIINRNGAHLLSLLNDTLDLSKIEAGKLETDIEKFELWPFVLNTVSLITEMAEAKQLILQVSARSTLPRFIYSDEIRLRQILFNLLGNAIKFTDIGTVELQVGMDGSCLEFHIIDTGKGMSRSDLKRIFIPFSQLSATRKQGTGLGLAISQKLAQKLGGSIHAHSIEGGGSRFIVRVDPGDIDLGEVAELLPLDDRLPPPIQYDHAFSGSILVVDDVNDLRELISSILSAAGIQVLTAANGGEALTVLDSTAPGLITMVLMDLNMPVLDGYKTLQVMRERGYQIPVIALTAASLQGEREKCMNAGFSSYLTKPVTATQLLAEVRQHALRAAPAPTPAGSTEILVVEDNEDANSGICMLLSLLGYHPRGVHSAEEALSLFEEKRPEVVLADLDLGDSDGLQLLKELHMLAPELRYFILSG